jgi:hypothetical protein
LFGVSNGDDGKENQQEPEENDEFEDENDLEGPVIVTCPNFTTKTVDMINDKVFKLISSFFAKI